MVPTAKVDLTEDCLHFFTRRANRAMNKIYDNHLQACGIKGGQFTLLRIIGYRGETTNSELQEMLLMDQTSLTRSLRPLIRDGYVEVSKGDDRRIKLLSLSPEGKELAH